MQDIEILSQLFEKYSGLSPARVRKLNGAGSNRRYYRLTVEDRGDQQGFSCIGVGGDNLRDCRAFTNLSRVFRNHGLPVPEVYEVSGDGMHYIQQDLGDISLFDIIGQKGPDSTEVRELVKASLAKLVEMQTVDRNEWERYAEYPAFSKRQVMWDLNYFKYEYLKPSGVDFDENLLEDDFEKLADRLTGDGGRFGFMYRDFQSRNIMVCGGKPFFIDYQGGRPGPLLYDAVSFLGQAKAGFSEEFRHEMIHYYLEQLEQSGTASDRESVLSDSDGRRSGLFALFRTLQVLGAYGLRGLVERKAHFIESIPLALANLERLKQDGILDDYPELKRVAATICTDRRFVTGDEDENRLHVKVFSFSYKKGYPSDYTGNGGGFMFDCRGMHNPGRYAEYRELTGLDTAVITFLEERGEVQKFVDNAYALVSPSVETYLRRGFSDLQIGFGCTGGRHRSVYCAEHLARRLAESYPDAIVEVIHREQGMERIIKFEN